MYAVVDYGRMIADPVRMAAYASALGRHVKKGSIVVDLGAGTGIFSLLACGLGASRVYAIETNDAICIASALAKENSLSDRISTFQATSAAVDLPERADVIVSDLRGVLPLFGQHLSSVADARERFLKPGGTLIPCQDTLRVAIVEKEELYRWIVSPWEKERFGWSMDAACTSVLNSVHSDKDFPFQPSDLLSDAKTWATLDYGTITSDSLSGEVDLQATRAGWGHGLALWFDATLDSEASFSNAPGSDRIYGRAFFPWLQPTRFKEGDRVSVTLRAQSSADGYQWGWNARVESHGEISSAKEYRQATFLGTPFSRAQLEREVASYVPRLHEEGEIDRAILGWMDGTQSLQDIAARARAAFPRIRSEEEARTRVRLLARKVAR